jgi:hypothetical protein
MEHRLRSRRVEDRVRVADIADVELGSAGDLLALAAREVVEDMYLVATREQGIDHV